MVWRNPGLAAQLGLLSQNLSCSMAIVRGCCQGDRLARELLRKIAQGNIGIVCSQVTGILSPVEVAACTPLGAVSKAIWLSHP